MNHKSIPGLLLIFLMPLSAVVCQNVVVSVLPSAISAPAGSTITVSIEVDVSATSELLGSYSAILDWNASSLHYQSNSGLLSGFSGTINDTHTSSGQLIFNGALVSGAGGDFKILTVEFLVLSAMSDLEVNFSAMAAAFSFVDLLPGIVINNANILVGVDDKGKVQNNLRLNPPFPNPAGGEVFIEYALPQNDEVSIALFDVFGKEVSILLRREMPSGTHLLKWDASGFEPGIYLLHLNYQDQRITRKIAVHE